MSNMPKEYMKNTILENINGEYTYLLMLVVVKKFSVRRIANILKSPDVRTSTLKNIYNVFLDYNLFEILGLLKNPEVKKRTLAILKADFSLMLHQKDAMESLAAHTGFTEEEILAIGETGSIDSLLLLERDWYFKIAPEIEREKKSSVKVYQKKLPEKYVE